MSSSALFQPITVGNMSLKHRVILAPLSRLRNQPGYFPSDLAVEYYSQRASTPGTLLLSESTCIAPQAAGFSSFPGIWSEEQIASWKKVADAVHARGSYIILQLAALGRSSIPTVLQAEGDYPYVSASDVPAAGGQSPRSLTISEIKEYTQLYVTAAEAAVHKAGFDGVELHNADGCLLDQFTSTVTNKRTDEYGDSVENRLRFTLETVDAVVKAVGAKKVGIRISPWSQFADMRMPDDDLASTFTQLVSSLRNLHPDLGFLHVIQPRVSADNDDESEQSVDDKEDDVFLRAAWGDRTYIAAGGFTRESAIARAETGNLVAFGRLFISNPNLPVRLRDSLPLTPYNRTTFYTPGPEGYIDYPFVDTL